MMLHFIISFRHHYGGITDRIEESFKNSLMQDAVLTFATKSYRVDVLWCQPIKLIHVVSTSEFHEY